MDRAENFDTLDMALFRAEDLRATLVGRRLAGRARPRMIQLQGRHRTVPVRVGGVIVGGGAPVVVQSMTMTDTADAPAPRASASSCGRPGRRWCG